MGAFLADQDLRPDTVILSSSARTVETWDRARQAFATEPDNEISGQLYHADPASMLEMAKALPNSTETAMLIGHNPGIGAMTRNLANDDVSESSARAFEKFPTAAVAVFEADIDDWRDLEFGACEFTRYVMPKDLV